MTMRPYASELIDDPQFEALVASLCRRPGMYVGEASFVAVCAYLDGFDHARSHGPLIGLREWLVVRSDGGNNLNWSALAQSLLQHDLSDTRQDEVERGLRSLGDLLSEFFEHRRTNGLTSVFHDYAAWLVRQPWYKGPLAAASILRVGLEPAAGSTSD